MHIPNGGYRDNQHEWSTQDIYHIEKNALFYNGEYLTNEQMNDTKFLKLVAQ